MGAYRPKLEGNVNNTKWICVWVVRWDLSFEGYQITTFIKLKKKSKWKEIEMLSDPFLHQVAFITSLQVPGMLSAEQADSNLTCQHSGETSLGWFYSISSNILCYGW